jgi:hypothetical protein
MGYYVLLPRISFPRFFFGNSLLLTVRLSFNAVKCFITASNRLSVRPSEGRRQKQRSVSREGAAA